VELERAQLNIQYLRSEDFIIEHRIIDLSSAMGLFESSLLLGGEEIPEGHYEAKQMKSTVVPNRNAIFASILYGYALSVATRESCKVEIALGVHSGDHEIYPDCRPEFYHAIEHAFAIGNWESENVSFSLPYLNGDKASILVDAQKAIAQLNLDFNRVFANTNTSYNPDAEGRSSGKSGADIERILAFHSLGLADPVEYQTTWEGVLKNALEVEKAHNEEGYRQRLTEEQFVVTRQSGTERAFTGIYWDEERNGDYFCICCGHLLFTSSMKFDSGCGWPSFHTEHRDAGIKQIEDYSRGRERMEVQCSKCDAHLGHIFEDGPQAFGGQRYCINSASLEFEEMDE
jgi:7-cyano-7-deazaguanine synthase